jgi:hypothetical protein
MAVACGPAPRGAAMSGKGLKWRRIRAANKPTQYSGVRFPQDDLGQRAKATFTAERATLTPKQRRTLYAPPKAR